MIEQNQTRNAFEFVAVASARARQLLRGCTPKVDEASAKTARVAMQEVKAGAIRNEAAAGESQS